MSAAGSAGPAPHWVRLLLRRRNQSSACGGPGSKPASNSPPLDCLTSREQDGPRRIWYRVAPLPKPRPCLAQPDLQMPIQANARKCNKGRSACRVELQCNMPVTVSDDSGEINRRRVSSLPSRCREVMLTRSLVVVPPHALQQAAAARLRPYLWHGRGGWYRPRTPSCPLVET